LTLSKLTPARHTRARSIALGATLLLFALTAFALGRRIHQQPQTQQQPAPQPYQDSFPVARPVTHTRPASRPAALQSTANPSPTNPSPTSPSTNTPATNTPAATTPSPHATSAQSPTTPAPATASKPKTPAERLSNAISSLPPLPFHVTTIVIDPAHGGADSGSRISDSTVEKDVTLALAFRLRSLLTARGFNVVLTRQDDKATNPTPPFALLTLDGRAGIANHQRASACLFLHATSRGNGVHLYTSELPPITGELTIEPWLTGQAPWVTQSQRLANSLSDAFNRARVPLVSGSASVRPLDSLTCPALVIELAPSDPDDPDSINDSAFQQRVALATANALILWKNNVQQPPHIAPPTPATTETTP
jgi:N-acetylmuramoyl-L-alanine amidase